MGIFRKTSKKEQMVQARRKRRSSENQDQNKILQPRRIGYSTILLTFSVLLILICFLGQSPAGPQVIPGQVAKTRIVADFSFSYLSEIKTSVLQEQRKQMVAPIYKISMDPYNDFSKKIISLNQKLEKLEQHLSNLSEEDRALAINKFTQQFNSNNRLNISPEDVGKLLELTDDEKRDQIFTEALITIKELMRDGIYDVSESNIYNLAQEGYFFNFEIEGSTNREVRYQNEEEALRYLRINIASMDIKANLATVIFHIFKAGLVPNLIYDAQKSNEKIEAALSTVEPVYIYVEKGQTIIEPGVEVSAEALEQLSAYRHKVNDRDDAGINMLLLQRIVATLIIMVGVLFYIKIALPDFRTSKRYRILPALLILFNLGLVRLLIELGDTNFFSERVLFISSLAVIMPIAIAPILTTLLIGARPAVLVGLIVSSFSVLMLGADVSFFFIYFLATLIGIYFSKNVRLRAKVFQASIYTGLAVGAQSFLFGIIDPSEFKIVAIQCALAIAMGVLSGIIVVGLRPILENLFNITTNFTLLELTDFNHPLLRKMQMDAPGTYHHSLMVANLSERAAAEIGANPLLCRACSLFHDIGKLSKPEYFVENQREGINPHDEKTPSMSALIIKNHVKEGLELAQEYKLPKPIMDVIEQHHGNSLIQYFYTKALIQAKAKQDLKNKQQEVAQTAEKAEEDSIFEQGFDEAEVDETTFRYEGSIPNTKESAIISFADVVEAACRCLKKPNLQNIEELIDKLFQEKINDHQMDNAPLSLDEIYKIKKSFAFTALDMLHSRIEYPAKEDTKKDTPQNA